MVQLDDPVLDKQDFRVCQVRRAKTDCPVSGEIPVNEARMEFQVFLVSTAKRFEYKLS